MLNDYRVTRRKPYGPGTPGHTDLSARQGYYITAPNAYVVIAMMAHKFPGEDHFDIQDCCASELVGKVLTEVVRTT